MITHIDFVEGADMYRADLQRAHCISLPLQSGSENPGCYYAEDPEFSIIQAGDFIGNVAAGGPVNHRRIHLSPHGNGTHTECYGHISREEVSIHKALNQSFALCRLLSIQAEKRGQDEQITLAAFQAALGTSALPPAIAIRSLPNGDFKKTKSYSGSNPPYLEAALAHYLAEHQVMHLLVDLPSVDPEVDGGALAAHKAFWNFPAAPRKHATITELIYAPPHIKDGLYVVHLQIAPLVLDASPSRIFLHPVQTLTHVQISTL